jgi:predicted Zn-dependent protease
MKKTIRALAAATAAACLLSACVSIAQSLTGIAQDAGIMGKNEAAALNKTAGTADEVGADLKKALDEITPEQEYYIGRAVAATIFSQYKVYSKKDLNAYLNQLGTALTLYCDRPAVFGGYHFAVLDSQEINAFATPSGIILVSRGLIALTSSEDELAAVLAHEIAHVTSRHGLKSIKSARFGQAMTKAATEAGKLAGGDLKEVTGVFSSSIGDIANTMIQSGYSKSSEFEADLKAAGILADAGYDPRALQRVLQAMERKTDPSGKGFSKTHPKPADRIKVLQKTLDALKADTPPANKAQVERYSAAMKAL